MQLLHLASWGTSTMPTNTKSLGPFWGRDCSLKRFLQSSAGARALSIFDCQDPAVAWKSVTLAIHHHAAGVQAAAACSSHRTKQGHMSVHGRQLQDSYHLTLRCCWSICSPCCAKGRTCSSQLKAKA